MSLSFAAPEKLGPKKLISKTAAHTATISTINIGVEDFPELNSSEEAHYGSSQRPPRWSGGSVHFNMSPASKASPRQTIQTNKTAPASKASAGNGTVPDSSAVIHSIANRGRKSPGSNLVRLLHRDINTPEALSRQVCHCQLRTLICNACVLYPFLLVVLSFDFSRP